MSLEETTSLPVTVVFSTSGSKRAWYHRLLSWIIRKTLGSKQSHASIAFYVSTNGGTPIKVVLEAESAGVWRIPWSRWRERHNKVIAEYEVLHDAELLREALAWASENYVGRPYDFRGAGLAGLYRWFAIWIRGRFNSPLKLYCSELVLRTLNRAKMHLLGHFDPEVTGPKRLRARLDELPEYFSRVEHSGTS